MIEKLRTNRIPVQINDRHKIYPNIYTKNDSVRYGVAGHVNVRVYINGKRFYKSKDVFGYGKSKKDALEGFHYSASMYTDEILKELINEALTEEVQQVPCF